MRIPRGPADQPASGAYLASQSKQDASSDKNMSVVLDRLADAIDNLPITEQMVIGLRYHDQLNSKEIGLVLNLTESKVDQLHRRAITRLRIAFRQGLA